MQIFLLLILIAISVDQSGVALASLSGEDCLLRATYIVPSIGKGQQLAFDETRVRWESCFNSSTKHDVMDKMVSFPLCVDRRYKSLATYYIETFHTDVQDHCDTVNPVFISGVRVNLNSMFDYNIARTRCVLEVDLGGWRPLPKWLNYLFDPEKNDKLEIIEIALVALEKNAFGPVIDCMVNYKGLDKHEDLYIQRLPDMFLPLVNRCYLSVGSHRGNRKEAIQHNWMGMEYHRAKKYKNAISEFTEAINADCNYFIAYTNLASTLAIEGEYYKSLAVLRRAKQRDPMLTLKKLLMDKDYRTMLKENIKGRGDYDLMRDFIYSMCPGILRAWTIDTTIEKTRALVESLCEIPTSDSSDNSGVL